MRHKKQLAGRILKVSPSKVKFAEGALEEIKRAITRADIRGLIAVGKIKKSGKNEQSRVRARKIAVQKRKGRQKGRGTKKGSATSVVSRKEKWMAKVRVQRAFLKELRSKGILLPADYQKLYRKSSGGFFRNKRHIKLYIDEHKLNAKNTTN